jgi:tetratricopeptide (TPR) repeat protein
MVEDAQPALDALERLGRHTPQTAVLRGIIMWERGDLEACSAAFEEAEKLAPGDPVTQTYLGRLYLRQRRWKDAERAFRRTLEIDPDTADAHYGLGVALPRQDLVEEGVDHALLAVGLRHEFPEAHFQLGALMSRLGWYEGRCRRFNSRCGCGRGSSLRIATWRGYTITSAAQSWRSNIATKPRGCRRSPRRSR